MTEEITVYRENHKRACLDRDTQRLINGTEEKPQTVPCTLFVQQMIKSGVSVEVKQEPVTNPLPPDPPPQDNEPTSIEAFGALSATEQKEHLQKLEITGDDSNEEKRIALYTAFLEAQAQ